MKEIDLLTTELSGVLPKEEILEAYNYVMNKPEQQAQLFFRRFNTQEGTSQPLQDDLNGLDPSGMTPRPSNI
jgi:hypothetical protein